MNLLRKGLHLAAIVGIVIIPLIAAAPPAHAAPAPGSLVRGTVPTVYYAGADGKRYPFPDAGTFYTWYPDFSRVVAISDSELNAMPIGSKVTYRPGTRLVRFRSAPQVYAVSAGGLLRWIPDPATAVAYFGASWQTSVDVLADTSFVYYSQGTAISASTPYDAVAERSRAVDIGTDKGIAAPVAVGGLRLAGRNIKDASGKTIVARGPEMVIADTYDADWIDAAAQNGANSVRFLLTLDAANRMTPETFDALIGRAVSRGMVVWISLYTWDGAHGNIISSALGGGNFYSLTAPEGTGVCSTKTPAPCYLAVWSRPWLKTLAAKYKGNIIIDAMQEYIGLVDPGTEAGRVEWASSAKTNIRFLRGQGYIQPLEIMSNHEGRDLYAIVQKGAEIRSADSIIVDGSPQTMFGWQAYWAAPWYKSWQGELLLGIGNGAITGAEAIHRFVANQNFPIQVGINNYPGDTSSEYKAEMDQASADGVNWLWWSWGNAGLECPVDGAACQAYVAGSQSGFAGAGH